MKEKIKNSEAGAKNLLVSFSGGETSAFMAQWLNNHYEEYGYENIVFVFANTGLENEKTKTTNEVQILNKQEYVKRSNKPRILPNCC